jgi:hypothetical protein
MRSQRTRSWPLGTPNAKKKEDEEKEKSKNTYG